MTSAEFQNCQLSWLSRVLRQYEGPPKFGLDAERRGPQTRSQHISCILHGTGKMPERTAPSKINRRGPVFCAHLQGTGKSTISEQVPVK